MVDHRMVKHDSQEQLPSHFHRITEWPRHLWVRLIQPLLKQVPKAACPGPRPGGVWGSPRRGDFTTSLGNLLQCLVTYTVS